LGCPPVKEKLITIKNLNCNKSNEMDSIGSICVAKQD